MPYYKDLDSYNHQQKTTRTIMVRVVFSGGESITSSAIPYSPEALHDVEEDITLFYQGEPLVIWNKDIGVQSYVHLRDVREVKLLFVT